MVLKRQHLWMALPLAIMALSGCATNGLHGNSALPAQALYVAMGSSFAAGPGIDPAADSPTTRCSRSSHNYAHELARDLNLMLVDVSCSGAATAHILGPWDELPPQIDAVTADTRLVTITIGGNDVGYVGHLMAASCVAAATSSRATVTVGMCDAMRARRPATTPQAGNGAPQTRSGAPSEPNDADWARLEANMRAIVAAVHQRAPDARIIFVDYVTLLPGGLLCAETPLLPEDAVRARRTAARLEQITATVARSRHVDLLRASALSSGHDACAAEPWSQGLIAQAEQATGAPYHPNARGMRAIADALAARLRR